MNDQQRQPDPWDHEVRDRLRGFAPPAPDRVWDRIEQQLEGRRRWPAAWFWWLAAGFLLGLAGWWLTRQPAEKMEDPVIPFALPREESFAPSQGETRGKKIIEEPVMPSIQAQAIPNSPRHSFNSQTTQPSVSASSGTTNQRDKKIHQNNPGAISTSEISPGLPLNIESPGPGEISQPTWQNPSPFLPLASVMAGVSSLNPVRTLVLPAFSPPPAPGQTHVRRRLELGITIGPTWIIQSDWDNSNTTGQNLVFSETIHTASESRMGLNLGFRLNPRWRIEAGLSRQKSVQQTSHSATMRLIDGVVLNPYDPGIKNYEFQYSLLSGANRSEVTVRISQEDPHVSMPVDEPFTLQMQTTRRSVEWLLPVSAQRLFGRGRWQASLRGGLAFGWNGKSTLEVHHFTEQCVDLCFQTGHKPQVSASQAQGLAMHYLTGAGLQFQVTPRFRLAVEPQLNGTLINIRGNGRQTQLALGGQAIYSF